MTLTIGKSRCGQLSGAMFVLAGLTAGPVTGQQPDPQPVPTTTPNPGTANAPDPSLRDIVFDMGQIVVVGSTRDRPGVGGAQY